MRVGFPPKMGLRLQDPDLPGATELRVHGGRPPGRISKGGKGPPGQLPGGLGSIRLQSLEGTGGPSLPSCGPVERDGTGQRAGVGAGLGRGGLIWSLVPPLCGAAGNSDLRVPLTGGGSCLGAEC